MKTAPSVFRTVPWTTMHGCRVGIDIQCFMYRALSAHTTPIKVIAAQIVGLRRLGIDMVYVFDGPPPVEKEQTVETRRDVRKTAHAQIEVLKTKLAAADRESDEYDTLNTEIRRLESAYPQLTYEMKDEIKRLFDLGGIQYINAKFEADSVLAHLYRRGQIDCVISFDLDFLARGVRLAVPRNVLDEPGTEWTLLVPEEICRALRLTDQQFVDLCVLMGSDYTPNLPIVPWTIALQSIRQGMSIDRIWSRHTFSNWRRSNGCAMEKQTVDELNLFKRARMILSGQGDPDDSIADICNTPTANISLGELRGLYPDWSEEWLGAILKSN